MKVESRSELEIMRQAAVVGMLSITSLHLNGFHILILFHMNLWYNALKENKTFLEINIRLRIRTCFQTSSIL